MFVNHTATMPEAGIRANVWGISIKMQAIAGKVFPCNAERHWVTLQRPCFCMNYFCQCILGDTAPSLMFSERLFLRLAYTYRDCVLFCMCQFSGMKNSSVPVQNQDPCSVKKQPMRTFGHPGLSLQFIYALPNLSGGIVSGFPPAGLINFKFVPPHFFFWLWRHTTIIYSTHKHKHTPNTQTCSAQICNHAFCACSFALSLLYIIICGSFSSSAQVQPRNAYTKKRLISMCTQCSLQ